ncbi:hypothetical protein CALVIDRAFT_539955 [Calocera viscosa TUFC12733]|uniref:Uncharacterized protein n=1 Tax=Calocera viscosa (strain TUFC12733) TaxID=1330018 RepID=A0A167JE67_CALVF|nr:hypothetical protein CALVIDRAFT_539955 [Calocera viscosa TUFC12733]
MRDLAPVPRDRWFSSAPLKYWNDAGKDKRGDIQCASAPKQHSLQSKVGVLPSHSADAAKESHR